MVAQVDPRRARLYPEDLPEAISVTSSTSGTSIASYAAFEPKSIYVRKLMTAQTPGSTVRLDNDSGHAVIEDELDTRPDRKFVDMEIPCYDSLDLWMTGTAYPTYCSYVMRVTKPTIFDKIRYGRSLSDDESAKANEMDITNKFIVGMLRQQELNQFKKIITIHKKVTVTAGSTTRVGRIINVKKGEKAVLLGVAVDAGAVLAKYGGPGVNDTYFDLNRDLNDTNHIRLDCAAMPNLDTEIPCYIPAVNKHEILIESATGITDLPVYYRYGIAPLTLIEKLRWEYPLTKDEKSIADRFNLEDVVETGVF